MKKNRPSNSKRLNRLLDCGLNDFGHLVCNFLGVIDPSGFQLLLRPLGGKSKIGNGSEAIEEAN